LAGREDEERFRVSSEQTRQSSNNGLVLKDIDDCLLARAWDHYKNFIGIINNGDDENEIDDNGSEAFEGGGDNIKSSCVRL
jgi:hypothetical protein